jgi:hypothetical protein
LLTGEPNAQAVITELKVKEACSPEADKVPTFQVTPLPEIVTLPCEGEPTTEKLLIQLEMAS